MFKTILRTTTAKEIDCDMCIGDACQRRISLPFIRRSLSGARMMKSSSISVGASTVIVRYKYWLAAHQMDVYARHHNREACLALLATGADPMVRLGKSGSTVVEAARATESPTLIQRMDLDFQIAAANLPHHQPDLSDRHPDRPQQGIS